LNQYVHASALGSESVSQAVDIIVVAEIAGTGLGVVAGADDFRAQCFERGLSATDEINNGTAFRKRTGDCHANAAARASHDRHSTAECVGCRKIHVRSSAKPYGEWQMCCKGRGCILDLSIELGAEPSGRSEPSVEGSMQKPKETQELGLASRVVAAAFVSIILIVGFRGFRVSWLCRSGPANVFRTGPAGILCRNRLRRAYKFRSGRCMTPGHFSSGLR